VPYRCFSVIVISETFSISFDFFSPVFYITSSYYQVYASLLSLLQLFFCLHVRLLCVIKYYLLTCLRICYRNRYFTSTFLPLDARGAKAAFSYSLISLKSNYKNYSPTSPVYRDVVAGDCIFCFFRFTSRSNYQVYSRSLVPCFKGYIVGLSIVL